MELNFNTARPAGGAAVVRGPSAAPRSEREEPERAAAPVLDRYVPEEKQPSAGLYRLGRDEDGEPRVYFDDPEAAPEGLQEGSPEPEEPESRRPCERTTADTGKVDREIERLKKEREQLERQLRTETDGARARELERKLARVEHALRQKDNDAYRRQHTEFS